MIYFMIMAGDLNHQPIGIARNLAIYNKKLKFNF